MMRLPLVVSFFIGFVCIAMAENPKKMPADEFVDQLVPCFKSNELAITQREKEALRDSHRILLAFSDLSFLRPFFWQIVRNSPKEKIEWYQAKQLIMEGKVFAVTTSHDGTVDLNTRDGRSYSTKQPEKEHVFEIVKQVDPKGVFILRITE